MFKLKQVSAACALAAAALLGAPAQAQISGDVIKIGIITDMSGLYSDIDGQGGVEAMRMAVADVGGKAGLLNGKKVEILFADHQNKADVAAAKAREWFDTQGVDMLMGGTTRAPAWR
jgi:branched-chain amino acid transport system substrate-binding protein